MEQKKWWQKKGTWIGLVALVLVAAGAIWAWTALSPKPQEGAKTIAVEIVHHDKSKNTLEIATNEAYLRGALEQENLISGDESDYGLFVKTVDGETADSDAQEWWSFTKDGVMLETGVDSTPIADGEHYEITFTVGY